MTTSTTFVFALLLGAGAAPAAGALAVASVLADLRSGKAWWKVVFNVGRYTLTTAAAWATLTRLGACRPTGSEALFHDVGDLLATAAAAAVFFVVNVAVTGTALAISEGRSPLALFRDDFTSEMVSSTALLALGPAVLVVADRTTLLLPALLLPIAVAYRSSLLAVEKEHQAAHDALTGLPNRGALRRAGCGRRSAGAPTGTGGWCCSSTWTASSDVNDTLGHHTGDELLARSPAGCAGALRQDDTVARLGGDEFALVLPGVRRRSRCSARLGGPAPSRAGRRARRRRAAVEASSASRCTPTDGPTADVLLQQAEVAMYQAKASGTGVERLRRRARTGAARRDWRCCGELRHAPSSATSWSLHYQPKVDVAAGAVARRGGAGALAAPEPRPGAARRVHPDGRADRAHRAAHPAGCCAGPWRQAGWHDAGHDLAGGGQRVGPRLRRPGAARPRWPTSWPSRRRPRPAVPRDHREPRSWPTRTARRGDAPAAGHRRRAVAVDDFGTGHSALAYLGRLPGHRGQDRPQLRDDHGRRPQAGGHRPLEVALGHRLGLRVVAEGVETPATSNASGPWGATSPRATSSAARWRSSTSTGGCNGGAGP